MNDTWVTLVGNVVAEPALRTTAGGVPVLTLRVASTPRRYDRQAGEWRDSETSYLDVSCWRGLADSVKASVRRGEPVVVHGRLLQRTYDTAAGDRRVVTEVEAATVGHDLSRGLARFSRRGRPAPVGRPLPASAAEDGPAGLPVEGAVVEPEVALPAAV